MGLLSASEQDSTTCFDAPREASGSQRKSHREDYRESRKGHRYPRKFTHRTKERGIMRFQKYSSIENHYRPEVIERIQREMPCVHWVATEKIHGANFSIWVNATRTKIAKRTGLLGDGTGFFNVYQIAPELKRKARDVFGFLKRDYKKLKAIAIYGELCGGCYPHPKVTPNPRFKKVQQGIWYSPNLEFLVFDIKLIFNADKDGRWLSVIESQFYANYVGLHSVPLISHGTFEAMLKVNNAMVSRVPKMLGLPNIKQNTMEGLVIRPVDNRYLRRGERVIIKSKNAKWSEKVYHKPRKVLKLTGFRKKFADLALTMINKNRYDAVVSKMGDVSPKDFGKIMGEIIQDVHSQIIDDAPKLYMQFQDLDKTERKLIHRVLAPEVAVIIREKLLGIKAKK